MSTVDLEADSISTGSASVQYDKITSPVNPTRLIFVRNGTYTGGSFKGGGYSGWAQTQQYQDTNKANYPGNPNGYLATYLHNFIQLNPYQLADVTSPQVYDLRATDSATLVVIWPSGTSQ